MTTDLMKCKSFAVYILWNKNVARGAGVDIRTLHGQIIMEIRTYGD